MNSSTTPNFSTLCQTTHEISASPGFRALLILEIFAGLAASLPNAFLIFSIRHVTVFHANLRLVLAHLSFCLLWYSFGYVVKAVVLLPVLYTGDPCSLITQIYECKLKELGLGIPAQATVYAGIALALERLYSTVRYKSYEQHSERTPPYLGIGLILFAYVVPVANTLNSLYALGDQTHSYLPICENTLSATKTSTSTTLGINLAAMTLCMVIVAGTWYLNTAKQQTMMANRAKHNLSARFQIEQNIQVNRIVVPSSVLQLLCLVPNYVFLFLILVGLPLSPTEKILLIHCNYIWKIIFALLHPIVCLARHSRIRKEFYKNFPFLLAFTNRVRPVMIAGAKWATMRGRKVAEGEGDGGGHGGDGMDSHEYRRAMDTHFQMLSSAWK